MDAELPRASRPSRVGLVVAFFASEAIVLAILVGPLVGQPWWRGFRNYFANDQLSYAGIASNVAAGDMRLVEPFTLTGSSYYPSLWYQVMGLVARVTGQPVHLVWTLLGLTVVSAGVLTVGWLAFRLSQRAWAPVVPALALLTGTLATQTAHYWYASLSAHAVLWGPFGTLFTLNAEVAGLSLGAIAITLLVLASWDTALPIGRRSRRALIAAAIIGLLANVQTYSFFTVLSLTAAFIAARSLIREPSRRRGVVTVVLVLAVLLLGRLISGVAGPLPTFALLLLAALPAVVPDIRRHPRLSVGALAIAALIASPQVLRTAWGLASGDPFLTYRQASTTELGVVSGTTLLAAIPLLLLLAACAVAVWRGSDTASGATLKGLVSALVVGQVLMSTNDLWGFNQEPYRFWLQYSIMSLLFLSAVLTWSIATIRSMPKVARGVFVALTACVVAVWALSLADFRAFWDFASTQGVTVVDAPRLEAARGLTAGKDGLVLSSACLDPGVLKNVTRGPVAAYNRGLAWPTDVQAFQIFADPDRRAGEDPVALRAANVRYVLTDSACANDWSFPSALAVVPLDTAQYTADDGEQTLTLWFVAPA